MNKTVEYLFTSEVISYFLKVQLFLKSYSKTNEKKYVDPLLYLSKLVQNLYPY